jgi:hypothetical protein
MDGGGVARRNLRLRSLPCFPGCICITLYIQCSYAHDRPGETAREVGTGASAAKRAPAAVVRGESRGAVSEEVRGL